jgi:hypothetical protein
MAIQTLANVLVTEQDWTEVSTGKVLLYVNQGTVRLVFSDTKPDVTVGGTGIALNQQDAFENGVGGTLWSRSTVAGIGSISVTTLE